jgi:fructose-1,6-bisphosphatase I
MPVMRPRASSANTDGDIQKDLDVVADGLFLRPFAPRCLSRSTDRRKTPADPDRSGQTAGAGDRSARWIIQHRDQCFDWNDLLDPSGGRRSAIRPGASFLQPGRTQIAAGFFIYGPQLALVLTVGSGTRIFIHSSKYGDFIEAYDSVDIPKCVERIRHQRVELPALGRAGPALHRRLFRRSEGPREKDFNMRWIASLVADCLPHPHPRRRVSLPGRPAQGICAPAGCAWSTRPIRLRFWSSRPAARRPTRSTAFSISSPTQPAPAHVRWSSARPKRSSGSRAITSIPSMIGERSPLFGNRGLFRV